MKPLLTDDIRKAYLDFYAQEGHAVIPGAPLVPENDPTVLFTTAGMHPLVPYLLGERHPAGKRLANAQRCIRTQDIDEVGDASHLTFFEMLGRWSLGDYFKEGAIKMSFAFLTQALGLPVEKLGVTCFLGDADAPKDIESAKLWRDMGMPEERIGYLPKAKNWWGPAGQTGPCGPDTEMFYWIGPSDLPPAGSNPATDEDRWLEIGNDVLMQYNKTAEGNFEPLAQRNVDEGMGLDRLAWVLQRDSGARNVYETDRIKPILETVLDLQDAGGLSQNRDATELQQAETREARIITDHLRAATFIIADGVHPGNMDQGYVLRRLIRRAIRAARKMGIPHDGSFSPHVAQAVIKEYGHFYGSLLARQKEIESVLRAEEQQFGKTLQEGQKKFLQVAQALPAGSTLDGQTVFHLYDTYGFPVELTKEMAAEHRLNIDEAGFKESFVRHQEKSRAGAEQKFAGGLADHSAETTKLHTATHLLNAALRTVLGDHVWQKGSNITADRLRFDFSHPDKMTPEQLKQAEDLVNQAIEADLPVAYHLTTVEGAKKEGAIGVFDDRYGSEVKVYVVGPSGRPGEHSEPFSREICGGPHVARTGMIGRFKILKEESSSAGIRRIKAVVTDGPRVIEQADEQP